MALEVGFNPFTLEPAIVELHEIGIRVAVTGDLLDALWQFQVD